MPLTCPSAIAIILLRTYLVLEVEEIDEWYNEHPYQVYKVPVQAGDFQIIGVVAPSLITKPYRDQCDHATRHVQQVQAGDAEEGGTEKACAPGILKQGHAFANQGEPLANVQQRKQRSEERRVG